MMISLQALVNFAVATGLVPTKGLPLPFISYGGSSLLVNMAAIGMLLSISKGEEGEVASNNRTMMTRRRARRKIETLKRKRGSRCPGFPGSFPRMRVIIAGGGTGGHLFPGLAVAEEFRNRDASTEVVFVGTEYGIEARVVPREGYPIKFLRAEGLVGVSMVRKIKAMVKIFLSVVDSYRIIKSVRPDIVIGVGGYASGTTMLLAFFLSIPTMILEQNSVPGVTNKILGRFVNTVCITYQESISFFPRGKTFLTGNPVRMQILKGSIESAYRLFSLEKGLFTIFSFGGSSGARSINRALVDALNYMRDLRDKIQFLHQTGPRDYESIRDAYRKAGFKGTISPFYLSDGRGICCRRYSHFKGRGDDTRRIDRSGETSDIDPLSLCSGKSPGIECKETPGNRCSEDDTRQ